MKACGPKGRKPLDNRRFVHALFWIGATGSPWRDLPAEFGHFRGVHKRFAGLCRRGAFERLFVLARDAGRPDLFLCSIDSTTVKAHPKAAGARRRRKERQSAAGSKKREALGRSVGGLSTKIHAACDRTGRLLAFFLTGGNDSDARNGPRIAKEVALLGARALCGDRAYDSKAVLDVLEESGIDAVTPSKKNRKEPRVLATELYKERNVVERLFMKLKSWRRIAFRFEKRARCFSGFVFLKAAADWIFA